MTNKTNLCPPFRKGVSGNPAGSSKKARARASAKRRLEAIMKQVFSGNPPQRDFALQCLTLAMNATTNEVKDLLEWDGTPAVVKVIVKEAVQDPNFALRAYQFVFCQVTADNTTVVEPEQELTPEQMQRLEDNIRVLLEKKAVPKSAEIDIS